MVGVVKYIITPGVYIIFVIGSRTRRPRQHRADAEGGRTARVAGADARQLRSPDGVPASSRDLANTCQASRRNVQHAIDSLAERSIITHREGSTTEPARYHTNVAEIVRIGGAVTAPPPTENTALTRSGVRVATSEQLHPILDRVLKCRTSKADAKLLAYLRRWLHSYMAKLGVDDAEQPYANTGKVPHPPDDHLVAQILPLATLILVLAYVNWIVIPIEENRLREVFGPAYDAYRLKVHRWLGTRNPPTC
jgi:hypothetical protein